MKICQVSNCTLPSTRSAVIAGQYYSRLCQVHHGELMRSHAPSSGHANYERGRDYEDNQASIVQPFTKDGKPSADFIKLYGDKAAEMWDEDTLRRFS